MLGLHDVGHAALARLAVHADHGLVGAAHVLGVDGQVRHRPRVVVVAQRVEALLDGVLVRTGERGVHQVAHVGVPRVHGQAVAVLGGAAQRVDVADVEVGVHAVGHEVQRQVHHVDVAGALAVAEQRALDPVGAGEHAGLGRGHALATVVVRVQRHNDRVAVADGTTEVLDDVAVDPRLVHLDRGGQVEDDLAVGGGLDDAHHRFAHLDGVVDLGAGEALGRVLVADAGGAHRLFELAAQLGRVHRDVGDARLVESEHDPPLQHRRRVVEVDDGVGGALQALVGALDELLTALHQHLDGDIVGHEVFLDQLAHEVEVGLRRRREADLDLLEAHLHERVEHAPLALGVHRVDERLVPVTKVDRAPQRRLHEPLVGPGAVGKDEGLERLVLGERHRAWGDGFRAHLCSCRSIGSR